MSIDFHDLDLTFARYEKVLNFPGYIPIVGAISGSLRMTAGKVMMVFSAIAALGFFIGHLFSKQTHYKYAAIHCLDYVTQGFANIFRSFFEIIPIVNLLLIAYDSAFRYTYPGEIFKPTVVVPIKITEPSR